MKSKYTEFVIVYRPDMSTGGMRYRPPISYVYTMKRRITKKTLCKTPFVVGYTGKLYAAQGFATRADAVKMIRTIVGACFTAEYGRTQRRRYSVLAVH